MVRAALPVRRSALLFTAATLVVGCSTAARMSVSTAISTAPTTTTAAVPGTHPSPKGWLALVRQQRSEKNAHLDAEVVWLGDSITYHFAHDLGKPIWDRYYAADSLNLGVGGDTTQNLLWRIDHGALAGLHPKTVVIEIGTNNVSHATPDAVADGIETVAAEVAAALPNAQVRVISVLPRSPKPGDTSRRQVDAVNQALAAAAWPKRVTFTNINAGWLTASGAQRSSLFVADRLHLSAAGYEELATDVNPLLK